LRRARLLGGAPEPKVIGLTEAQQRERKAPR
jgi:hypothetical protein